MSKRQVTKEIKNANPSLDSRVLISEEAEVEVPRPLPIQGETIHALRWVGSQGILEEKIWNHVSKNESPHNKLLTQFIFWPLLELLVRHQLFNATSHCLHVVDN